MLAKTGDFAASGRKNGIADFSYHLNIPINLLAPRQKLIYQFKDFVVHKILPRDISWRGIATGLVWNLISLYILYPHILPPHQLCRKALVGVYYKPAPRHGAWARKSSFTSFSEPFSFLRRLFSLRVLGHGRERFL